MERKTLKSDFGAILVAGVPMVRRRVEGGYGYATTIARRQNVQILMRIIVN